MHDDCQPARCADDRDVAVAIGAKHRDAEPRHGIEQHRRRVSVVVVQADTDHADAGVHRREEIWIRVRRAVVRDLEDVGAQVDATRQELALRLDLGVPG